jgi:hypothetical protein
MGIKMSVIGDPSSPVTVVDLTALGELAWEAIEVGAVHQGGLFPSTVIGTPGIARASKISLAIQKHTNGDEVSWMTVARRPLPNAGSITVFDSRIGRALFDPGEMTD